MSLAAWSLYAQVTVYRFGWLSAYALQLALRHVWAHTYLAYERLAPWKPVDSFDDRPCSGTILCERVGRRHRRDCLGRPERINALLREQVE